MVAIGIIFGNQNNIECLNDDAKLYIETVGKGC